MTEYKVTKRVLIGDELHRVDSYYSTQEEADVILNCWKVGDTDLDGNEIVREELYKVEDGNEVLVREMNLLTYHKNKH